MVQTIKAFYLIPCSSFGMGSEPAVDIESAGASATACLTSFGLLGVCPCDISNMGMIGV
jgi:hypothetical protein